MRDRPVLTVDMSRMNRLLDLDAYSCLATFQAGVRGPDLEASLRARGFTLGHYPQSFEYSTLGGWIATRSSGQQSLGYGRIEKTFAGGKLVTPAGVLNLPCFPASAAGPDLREAVLGSEGRMGIITEATVRITPLPEVEEFHGVFFPDFQCGMAAVKKMAQSSLPLSMLRLSTPNETRTTLLMAGREKLIALLNKYLGIRGVKENKCLLILGAAGDKKKVRWVRRHALKVARSCRGVYAGRAFRREWHKSRFLVPYMRNSLWDLGYAVPFHLGGFGLCPARRTGKNRKTNPHAGHRAVICGGGSKSDQVMQITADVFNLPAARPAVFEASGLGAAILAAAGAGIHANLPSAVKEMTRAGKVFEPNPHSAKIYNEIYRKVYRNMYRRLRSFYEDIRVITGYP